MRDQYDLPISRRCRNKIRRRPSTSSTSRAWSSRSRSHHVNCPLDESSTPDTRRSANNVSICQEAVSDSCSIIIVYATTIRQSWIGLEFVVVVALGHAVQETTLVRCFDDFALERRIADDNVDLSIVINVALSCIVWTSWRIACTSCDGHCRC